ncbi:unnamed protein product [Parascedosporium putredinis]|uniref:Uncharacterized protein n=1 Tax=Parascedosporium putredinis TaxID=1442378 RepID=A0A9P1H0K1_9PEZI|nr:unnamed protein product [Parascedosporium putredinis]CAI7994004.1 unnamed protein product [Parascedosporium putredinis]
MNLKSPCLNYARLETTDIAGQTLMKVFGAVEDREEDDLKFNLKTLFIMGAFYRVFPLARPRSHELNRAPAKPSLGCIAKNGVCNTTGGETRVARDKTRPMIPPGIRLRPAPSLADFPRLESIKGQGHDGPQIHQPPPDDVDRWLGGPFTHVLEDAAQANCFCIEARANFDACDRCLLAAPLTGQSTEDESGSLAIYMDDCVNMGYYANQTLAYPSTTRSADEGGADDNCENLCGVANGQIVECGLAPLDVPEEDRPRTQTVPSPDRTYLGWVLLNRTVAECVCTSPFLRRILGCELCLVEKERRDLALVGHHHRFDCHQLGYYSDAQYLLPGPEDVGGGGVSGGGSGARRRVTMSLELEFVLFW